MIFYASVKKNNKNRGNLNTRRVVCIDLGIYDFSIKFGIFSDGVVFVVLFNFIITVVTQFIYITVIH